MTEAAVYVPQNAHEKGYYDLLWDVARAGVGAFEISGIAAVTFFQRSGVDKGFLKQIWSLSTPSATMSLSQFYTALRFITMIQSGEIPLSADRLTKTSRSDLGLPKFAGVDVPPKPVQGPAHAVVAGTPSSLFAISPVEHGKYHNLFASYDTDKDGFLSRDEAWVVLAQSGLDPIGLERIWAMADEDRDRRLSSKEFCVAFHIIVGVTKRGQPMPDCLPPALHNFLQFAPPLPPNMDGAVPVPASAAAAPSPVPVAAASVPPVAVRAAAAAAVPAVSPASKISAEFDFMGSSAGLPAAAPLTAVAPSASLQKGGGGASHEDLSAAVDGMREAAHKAIAVQEQAIESGGRTYSGLTALRQRLATEKISLEATVANASSANAELASKFDQIVADISSYQSQLQELRNRHCNLTEVRVDTVKNLANAEAEKQQLMREIDEVIQQLKESGEVNADYVNRLTSTSADLAGASEMTKAVLQRKAVLSTSSRDVAQETAALQKVLTNLQAQVSWSYQQRSVLAAKLKSTEALLLDERKALADAKRAAADEEKVLSSLQKEKHLLLEQIKSIPEPTAAVAPLAMSAPEHVLSAVPPISHVPAQTASRCSPVGEGSPFDNIAAVRAADESNSPEAADTETDDPFGNLDTESPSTLATTTEQPVAVSVTPLSPVLVVSTFEDLNDDPFGGALDNAAGAAAPFGDDVEIPPVEVEGFDDFSVDPFSAPAVPVIQEVSTPTTTAPSVPTTEAFAFDSFGPAVAENSGSFDDAFGSGSSATGTSDFDSFAPASVAFDFPPPEVASTAFGAFDASAFDSFSASSGAGDGFDAFSSTEAAATIAAEGGTESFSESNPFGHTGDDPFAF